MFKSLAIAVVVCVSCSAAASAATLFDCNVNADRTRGFVAPRVVFVLDDKGTATVVDGIVLQLAGKPIPAKVSRARGKLRFKWWVVGGKSTDDRPLPKMRYDASITEASNSFQIVAKVGGFPDRFLVKGTCTSRKTK